MAFIDIQGAPHAYDLTPATGAAPVLVFIHGWLLSRSYWQPVIDTLAPNYQCLTYDLRGFGDSQLQLPPHAKKKRLNIEFGLPDELASQSQSTSSYTLAAYAEDLGILLQKLGIDCAWLIGHSLGGSIALWAAYTMPERIRGVICLNAGGGIYLKEEFERFRVAGQQLVRRRPLWLRNLPLIDLLFTRAMVARPLARRWGRQRLIDFVIANPEAALRTLLDSTTEAEVNRLPQVVSQLTQPVYFVAGAQDKVMEPKYVNHLASFHKLFEGFGNNVIEILECGHMAMVEQPDAVSSQILKILASSEDV